MYCKYCQTKLFQDEKGKGWVMDKLTKFEFCNSHCLALFFHDVRVISNIKDKRRKDI